MEETLQYVVTTFRAASLLAGKAVLEEAAKDAYGKLRDFLTKKASPTDVQALEDKPKDDLRKQILVRDLSEAFAVDEAGAKALFELAEALSQAIKTHHTETYNEFALDVQRNKVRGDFNITDNKFEGGAGIKAHDNEVGGNVNISGNESKKL